MQNIISTWIYLDSPEESSEYPQVGKASHLPEFQKVYWRCVVVFYELSVRNNPQCRHILFSNLTENSLPEVDGLDLKRFLKDRNVALVTLPLGWQAPKGWHGKWRNQFYIFDVLQYAEQQFGAVEAQWSDETALLVLDSDCMINRPLDALFEAVRRHGIMALPMGFPEDYNINGLTRTDMRALYTELDGQDPGELPEYCGGEIFAATLTNIRQINGMAPALWAEMNRRFETGQPKFNEEAHFLSYCYHKMGVKADLRKYIKRIWTSPKYNNVQAEDFMLPIWHLPAEKTGGIALLFKRLKAYTGRMMLYNGLEDLGGMLGIPRRTRYLNLKHWLKHTKLYLWLQSI